MTYNLTWPSNLPPLRRLATGADGVRVLVYNGDADPSVMASISQNVSYSLGLPVREPWRAWTTAPNGTVVGGQIVRFDAALDFVTLRGSGHMVPRYRAFPALLMLRHWLRDEDWPALPPAEEEVGTDGPAAGAAGAWSGRPWR